MMLMLTFCSCMPVIVSYAFKVSEPQSILHFDGVLKSLYVGYQFIIVKILQYFCDSAYI